MESDFSGSRTWLPDWDGYPQLLDDSSLVERLLEAKRDLRLTHELRRLDRVECLVLDDIGYLQHDRAEMGRIYGDNQVWVASRSWLLRPLRRPIIETRQKIEQTQDE